MTKLDMATVRELQRLNGQRREKIKGSMSDYLTVYRDFCRGDGNYAATFGTRLYNVHGGEYCSLLSVLERNFKHHQKS